jgi:hypothetical protein
VPSGCLPRLRAGEEPTPADPGLALLRRRRAGERPYRAMLHANCLAHLPCPSLRTLRPSVPLTGRIAIAVGQPLWVRWPCSAPIRALLRRPAVPGQHAGPRVAGRRRRHPLPVQVQVEASPACLGVVRSAALHAADPSPYDHRRQRHGRAYTARRSREGSRHTTTRAGRPGSMRSQGSSTTAREDDGDARRDQLVGSKRTITGSVRCPFRQCRSPCPGRRSATRVGT